MNITHMNLSFVVSLSLSSYIYIARDISVKSRIKSKNLIKNKH